MSFSQNTMESDSGAERQEIDKTILCYGNSLEYYKNLDARRVAGHPAIILQIRQDIGKAMEKLGERLSQDIIEAKKTLDDITGNRHNAMGEKEILALKNLGFKVFGELLSNAKAAKAREENKGNVMTTNGGAIDEDLERTRLSVNPEEAGLNALQSHMRKISMALTETLNSLMQKAVMSGRPLDQATLAVVIFNGLSQEVQKIVDEKNGIKHESTPMNPGAPTEMMRPFSQPGNPLDELREWKLADLNLHLSPEKAGGSGNGSK